MTRRCANYHCRTSLDEYPVECPHGLPFCGDCVFEDGCEECVLEPMRQRAAAAWEAAAPASSTDPKRQADIDSRAESRKEQDDHEYAELMMREQDARW